ncbi:MAG: 30S ribosome-binding factor RbfA [Candidatus Dasytiphilus stammeri]
MNEIIRLPKIAKALKKEITIILQKKIKDPRLRRSLISINHIDLSKDYFYAKVFITFLGIESNPIDISRKIKILQNASGYIRRLLAKAMFLRIIPKLYFVHDSSIYNAVYMYDFISKVLKKNNYE